MSRENVEIVRRVYDAIARGDTATVMAAYDPEVEWEFTRSPFGPLLKQDVYRGHDGIRAHTRERYEEAWAEVEDHLDEVIDAGSQVITVLTARGRGRISGAEVTGTHAGVWTFRGGKIVRVEWVGTRDEALEAVGLRE
jgi:ketosteroid isomerase-like protein